MMMLRKRISYLKKAVKRLFRRNRNDTQVVLRNHPEVYTYDGKKVYWLFLKDASCCHTPYTFSTVRCPQRIIWDRHNTWLLYHLYTYDDCFHLQGNPQKKFALFFECWDIMAETYRRVLNNKEYFSEFDAIFTNQKVLLEQFHNAYFVPSCAPWYGSDSEQGGGIVSQDLYQKKSRLISIVSSNKEMCALHIYRKKLAQHFLYTDVVECYGDFEGNVSPKKVACSQYLQDYMYHIAVENQISDGYFTEKITNCFMSMTVPIYIGAPDIGKYFNLDGIIVVDKNNMDNVDTIIEQCSREDYEKRIDAILDNFNRVKKYLCIEDYIINEYESLFIE